MAFMQILRPALRGLLFAAAAVAGIVFVVGFFARFGDGPLGPLPGGPLRQGEIVSAEGVDWAFVQPIEEVELQLLEPEGSRTTWIVVHGGDLYVPCGFLNVPFFKQWPHDALLDGRALLRVQDRLYPVQLARVTDATIFARVSKRLERKYGCGLDPETGWIFRLDPR